jgi:hypothetical protein
MNHFRFVFAAGLVLACFCGKANLEKGARVVVPPLPDGEVNEYQILTDGEPNGTFTMTTNRTEFRDKPAFRLILVARTISGNIPTVDSSVVFVTRDSLVPLTSFRFVRTGNAMVTTAANYTGSTVAISTFTQQEEKQRALPFGPGTYDSDQLTFLGRAIQLPTNKPVDIKAVSPMGPPFGGAVMEGKIGAVSDQAVTVPAGTFDCYKLVLNLGPHIVAMCYEKAGSHRMIRYETAGGGLVMELAQPTGAALRGAR